MYDKCIILYIVCDPDIVRHYIPYVHCTHDVRARRPRPFSKVTSRLAGNGCHAHLDVTVIFKNQLTLSNC